MGAYVLLYLFCQALFLAAIYHKIPRFIQYTQTITIIFYVSTIVAFISYFVVKLKPPGYLGTDEKVIPISVQDRRPTPCPRDFDEAKRYCLACHQDQPYRTKHCTICHKCIRGFDHHCPLVDNCIGQKNRPHFLSFLFFQTIQIIMALILVEVDLSFKHIDFGLLTFFIILVVLLAAMGMLFFFHLYLMFTNILTWQFFCWDSINYLDNYKTNTNPFNKGLCSNLKLYWLFGCFRKDFIEWQIEKPELVQNPI